MIGASLIYTNIILFINILHKLLFNIFILVYILIILLCAFINSNTIILFLLSLNYFIFIFSFSFGKSSQLNPFIILVTFLIFVKVFWVII